MNIKCKAITDLSFPKFNINVKKDEEFMLNPREYKEISIFENVRFTKLDDVQSTQDEVMEEKETITDGDCTEEIQNDEAEEKEEEEIETKRKKKRKKHKQ